MDDRSAHARRRAVVRGVGIAGGARALVVAIAALSPICGQAAFAACGGAGASATASGVDERLDIALADGRVVRLGGLDLPLPGEGAPQTRESAREFLATKVAGKPVVVVNFAAKPDRWGRLVGDLLTAGAAGDGADSTALALLRAGFARVRPQFETRGCAEERLAAEAEARSEGLGLWRDPLYSVIPSTDTQALGRNGGRLAVVEGKVRRVGFGRSRIYIDFGPRNGLTLVVARKSEAIFQRGGKALGALAGRTIRARGALDDRFSPRIEIDEPAMIEILQ